MEKIKLTFNSPVILIYILMSFAVLELGIFTGGSIGFLFETSHSSLVEPLTYVRLFTHVFGYRGWEHYLGNASYILLLGSMLEERCGSGKIIQVMLTTALVSGLINFFVFPEDSLCGGSGIVFAFILMTSFSGIRNGEISLTFILVAVIFICQQIYGNMTWHYDLSESSFMIGGAAGTLICGRHKRKKKI
jgi:GlpG protein